MYTYKKGDRTQPLSVLFDTHSLAADGQRKGLFLRQKSQSPSQEKPYKLLLSSVIRAAIGIVFPKQA
jgi:hypothetical protein